MIEVKTLHKRYGARVAVNDVSFVARDGEITGLLGSNGAGKTTTLRMVAGQLKPQGGFIELTGGLPTLGALLDHTGLYPRLTARENIEYFGQLRAVPDLSRRVEGLIGRLGLQVAAHTPAANLSQGQRMKVALARVLIHSPKHLLLDEPTSGLDIPSVRSLRDYLRFLRDEGCCIIFSSHVLDDVRALCDRIVIIARGSVVAQGTPDELCRQAACSSLEDAYLRLAGDSEVAA